MLDIEVHISYLLLYNKHPKTQGLEIATIHLFMSPLGWCSWVGLLSSPRISHVLVICWLSSSRVVLRWPHHILQLVLLLAIVSLPTVDWSGLLLLMLGRFQKIHNRSCKVSWDLRTTALLPYSVSQSKSQSQPRFKWWEKKSFRWWEELQRIYNIFNMSLSFSRFLIYINSFI